MTAHGMRGLHASLLYAEGAPGNIVATSMRHTHEGITKTSYAKKGPVRQGQQQRAIKVLAGGKR